MKKVVCVLMIMVMMFGICGCSRTQYEPVAKPVIGDGETYAYEEVELDDEFKSSTADFALELFRQTYKNGENSLVSPVSVLLALGMTANGANGDTLKEFEELLGQELTLNELNRYYATYKNMLAGTKKDGCTIANSIWVRDWSGLVVKEEFIKKNTTFYNAEIYKAAFDKSTVYDVNYWVSENTNGLIREIIKDEINPEIMMMLINALVFEGEWNKPYYENSVYDTDFTNINGEIETVEGMHGTEYSYIEDYNTKGFVKEYKNGYKCVIFLPNEDEDFDEYVASFSGEKYLNLINNISDDNVITMLPKFKYAYETNLNKTLQDMGLKSAFEPGKADFSGMFEANDQLDKMWISDVIHKTYIEMGEKGTKAAAVTAVMVAGNGAPMKDKEVICDRPFVYAIVDGETMLPVFIGSVSIIS